MKILLAGETWTSYSVHLKGLTAYTSADYSEAVAPFREALGAQGIDEVEHLPNHLATTKFPRSIEELEHYDVVILSDISADTLLLHPDTVLRSQRSVNCLNLLSEWVHSGGALLMIGGYLSFAGYEGKARYYMTSLADCLPVEMLTHDDRVETPEGVVPFVVTPHPSVLNLPEPWPHFLGYNRVVAKDSGTVVLRVGRDPLLTVGEWGRGRVAAFTSDLSPHWGPPEFITWEGYGRFWAQLIRWLAGADE